MKRKTATALITGFGIALCAGQISADDAPQRLTGKLVVRASEVSPGVPAAAQFRGLLLVNPETGEHEKVAGPELEGGFLSPDRHFLAGVSNAPGRTGIWILDLTGKTPGRRVFERPGVPTWSADGKQLVIGSKAGPANYDTYRVNADGSELTKLAIPESEFVVDWSRDGAWLASWNPVRKTRAIHNRLMHLDGKDAHDIVDEEGADGAFRISPDSREVAFAITKGDRGKEIASLWIANIDGTDRGRLPLEFEPRVRVSPRWSPDGTHLALGLSWSGRPPAEKHDQIVIVSRDGKQTRRVALPRIWRLALIDWR